MYGLFKIIEVVSVLCFCATANNAFGIGNIIFDPVRSGLDFLDGVVPEDVLGSFNVDDYSLLPILSDPNSLFIRKLQVFSWNTGGNPFDIISGDLQSLASSGFDVKKKTKVIVHGWKNSVQWPVTTKLTKSYLAAQDVNVIAVDWSLVAMVGPYVVDRVLVLVVGKLLADVLNWLVSEAGVSVGDIHIIGHSLGAHIAGIAGYHMKGYVARITGLDPAGPAFLGTPLSGRLDSSDAQFVDVIHTCSWRLGYPEPCGHVDFYPNGGVSQPGCFIIDVPGICEHVRAYLYFSESISRRGWRFMSRRCGSWQDYEGGKCDYEETAEMGEYVNVRTRGDFYLTTSATSPYALG